MSLTKEQYEMVFKSIGDNADFPLFTQDPMVNHAVDYLTSGALPWEDLSQEERDMYFEEVKLSQKEIS